MPKNTKVTQREHSNEPVTESVADLLSLEHPMDYKSSQMSMGLSPGSTAPGRSLLPEQDAEDGRPAWNNKLEYILAQVGFSVGLGNVWRFPYLCQKNGGGAYLVPYFILLILIGIPLFFLELAVGQRIRRGSIGVWNYVYPQLGGIGVSSLMVCGFVGLYYNVIIGWSIFYFFQSFQYPLPWAECPIRKNGTQASEFVNPECEKSSATTYFWYRQTLNITSTIDETGGLNWKMTLSLLVAWILVCLAVIKGIHSPFLITDLSISMRAFLTLFAGQR
uniref:Transporter n=1 Tax=Xiphophorus couchianus TaxID=32473 RepID=A0A3B5LK30_9TELE